MSLAAMGEVSASDNDAIVRLERVNKGYPMGSERLPVLKDLSLSVRRGELVSIMGGSLAIDAGSILLLLVSAVLLAAVVSAVLIGVCMFARSFKEAQSYVAPMSFLFVIPAVGLQFKDLIGLGDSAYYIPVFNALLVMDDIVKGTATAQHMLMTWGSLIVVIVLLLIFAYRNFTREDVIFRS